MFPKVKYKFSKCKVIYRIETLLRKRSRNIAIMKSHWQHNEHLVEMKRHAGFHHTRKRSEFSPALITHSTEIDVWLMPQHGKIINLDLVSIGVGFFYPSKNLYLSWVYLLKTDWCSNSYCKSTSTYKHF